jgi:creatinine amidohydrolase
VGATEQHGPHLPLSTDTDIAVALACELSRRVASVVVAPPVAYGASGEHQGFPGTISIGHEALQLLLVELVRSAVASFDRVILISTHGGNAEPVARAIVQLESEGINVTGWSPRWGGDAHAGRTETSVMLALHPARVGRGEAGNTAPLTELMPRLRAVGVRAVSPNGVLGDPKGASAREGRLLFDRAVEALTTVAREVLASGTEP